jgi:hypothetical protein
MKQATLNYSILHKIGAIEKDIMELKLSVLKKLLPADKKFTTLKGIFKGVSVTDKDIAHARKSLYGKIKI